MPAQSHTMRHLYFKRYFSASGPTVPQNISKEVLLAPLFLKEMTWVFLGYKASCNTLGNSVSYTPSRRFIGYTSLLKATNSLCQRNCLACWTGFPNISKQRTSLSFTLTWKRCLTWFLKMFICFIICLPDLSHEWLDRSIDKRYTVRNISQCPSLLLPQFQIPYLLGVMWISVLPL